MTRLCGLYSSRKKGSVNDITKGEHSKFFEMICRISDVNIGFNGRTINKEGVMALMVKGEEG